jgi:hypothetical protein
MCHVADESEPMARTDHVRAKRSKSMVGNRAGLEIPNLVGSVVHKLDVPDTALVHLLKPFQFPLKKIQSFNVAHYGRIALCVRGFQVCWPPNDDLTKGMTAGSLAVACLADVPDGPILKRNEAGVLTAGTPQPGQLYQYHLGRLDWVDEMIAHHGLRRALSA